MKTRVIIKNRKYVPQIKTSRRGSWRGLININFEIYQQFDSLDEAVNEIYTWKIQNLEDGEVIWEM